VPVPIREPMKELKKKDWQAACHADQPCDIDGVTYLAPAGGVLPKCCGGVVPCSGCHVGRARCPTCAPRTADSRGRMVRIA
jgi:hypothetical protein